MPTVQHKVDKVVNMMQNVVTPLLTHHHSTISNLSTVLPSPSRGAPPPHDDDSTGSINTESTGTGSLADIAINQL